MNQAPGTQNEEPSAAASGREDRAIIEQMRTTFPDSRVIATVSAAADQDGYDGGYVAREGDREAWGETPERAKEALNAQPQATRTRDENE